MVIRIVVNQRQNIAKKMKTIRIQCLGILHCILHSTHIHARTHAVHEHEQHVQIYNQNQLIGSDHIKRYGKSSIRIVVRHTRTSTLSRLFTQKYDCHYAACGVCVFLCVSGSRHINYNICNIVRDIHLYFISLFCHDVDFMNYKMQNVK